MYAGPFHTKCENYTRKQELITGPFHTKSARQVWYTNDSYSSQPPIKTKTENIDNLFCMHLCVCIDSNNTYWGLQSWPADTGSYQEVKGRKTEKTKKKIEDMCVCVNWNHIYWRHEVNLLVFLHEVSLLIFFLLSVCLVGGIKVATTTHTHIHFSPNPSESSNWFKIVRLRKCIQQIPKESSVLCILRQWVVRPV